MLHCRGGYLYMGHTDNLDRRVDQHEQSIVPGFVRDHWPAKLDPRRLGVDIRAREIERQPFDKLRTNECRGTSERLSSGRTE
jgi:putative endonuclease